MMTGRGPVTLLATMYVLVAILAVSGEAQPPQAGAPSEAAPAGKISLQAKPASARNNGTRNGEANSRFSVLIGGVNALASSTTDGTGNGDSSGGNGNNNGNNATGSGNGNGNGNNNAQIIIQNDPTFLTCPPCQYYDPSQQLCISVQSCLASKPATSPAAVSPPAAVSASATTAASASSTATGTVTSTAGRKLLDV